jgi:ABC-type methionine transport system permease subunit
MFFAFVIIVTDHIHFVMTSGDITSQNNHYTQCGMSVSADKNIPFVVMINCGFSNVKGTIGCVASCAN